jgi:hypothetical protein
MALRLPHVCLTTVTVTCELSSDLHTDLETYARLVQAERGTEMPLSTLIATILDDYLQHDPDFVRQRRQAAPKVRTRATATRATPQPADQPRRTGPLHPPAPTASDEGPQP